MITEFHAHVYFDEATRSKAAALRARLAQFDVTIGRWWEEAVGPHPCGNYEVKITPGDFNPVVPWLMLNRDGLSILVHPMTGDVIADHAAHVLWLGTPLALRDIGARRGAPVNHAK